MGAYRGADRGLRGAAMQYGRQVRQIHHHHSQAMATGAPGN
jgi:hypothetical protein